MKTIRWGIIGCGDVTERKSGPAFSKVPGSQLVAVMRRNGDAAADYAKRHGVPRWYDDADALIADPEVDAVYVATPPGSHASYAIAVATAGKPVYVEKPMARTLAECEAMIAACESAEVPLFVAYYRRCLPHFMQAKQWLLEGRIGEVHGARLSLFLRASQDAAAAASWRYDAEAAGGGLLFDLGSHQLDILDFLLGPVADVQGKARNLGGHYAVEDTVSARFTFESGTEGSALWCFAAGAGAERDEIELVGSRGKIILPTFGKTEATLVNADGVTEFEVPTPDHVQQGLIETIVAELRGQGSCPSTGRSAARTAWVLDQIAGR
ncbi:MAG: Gfo/Idh/MocA family oxidoreductase [Verrucomicrobiota bacterium]